MVNLQWVYYLNKGSDLLFAFLALITAVFCIKNTMLFKREDRKFTEYKKQYALEKANLIVDNYKNNLPESWE